MPVPFTIILAAASTAALLAIAYLLLLKPNRRREGIMKPFEDSYIAHRGFFDNDKIPENSLPAFEKAVEFGYGIELDVQLTRDGKLVVFHDESLKRMTGLKKKLTDLNFKDLKELTLLDSDISIPLLDDVLKTVDGKVPLIIEIKAHGPFIKTSEALAQRLDSYSGPFCIESFNPAVVRWFWKNRPEWARGILASNYLKAPKKTLGQKILVTNLMFNFYCKPDFVAYNHLFKESFSLKLCKKFFSCHMAAWTIRSQEELDKASEFFSVFIFEGFRPRG